PSPRSWASRWERSRREPWRRCRSSDDSWRSTTHDPPRDRRAMTDHDPGDEGTVPPDHERIEQLLAAHTLNSLDGEDQRDAERLLTEHLPGCERCREMLPVFRTLVAELALASVPVD